MYSLNFTAPQSPSVSSLISSVTARVVEYFHCVCVCMYVPGRPGPVCCCGVAVFVVEMWRCCEWTVKRAIRERWTLIRTEFLLSSLITHTHTEASRHELVQIAVISLLASQPLMNTCP